MVKGNDKTPPPSLETAAAKVDPEEFGQNIAKLVEVGGKALSAYLEPRQEGKTPHGLPPEMSGVAKTLGQVAENWMADPERAVQAQTELWSGYVDVWSSSMKRFLGQEADPVMEPDRTDKRFSDPMWDENPVFDFLKQTYLVTQDWAEHLVEDAHGLDDHTRQKADFYVKQLTNAIAPTNFFLTNPAILRETMMTNGENLVRGMEMLAEDIAKGEGDLKIRQSDETAFEVGKDLAMTPGKVVFENKLFQLIQYEPTTPRVLAKPLLVVPPWINKFYVLDLRPGKSFIEWCVAQGLSVFVISWVNPDDELADESFEDYMRDGILEAVGVVTDITNEPDTHIIGYCVGGTLLACTLAYMAATNDDRITSATFLTTQVDFTHAGDLKVFVDEEQLELLEARMKERGYLEGKKMSMAFNLLRSNDLVWPYIVNNYMMGKTPFPFDLLYWNSDSTRMPAANHAFYLRNCYLDNKLSQGQVTLSNIRLDLEQVDVPIYNLATREDHIAPPRSVFKGSACFGGPVEFVLSGSGHIAGVVNPPEKNKYQYWTGGAAKGEIEDWIEDAEEHPGSWWPHWIEWIRSHSDREVRARKPGSRKYKPIEDAPGRYVKVKA